jgi:MarR family transcriptional regulator, 2-MHQ and catechol-resistance regulon repressor
MKNSNKKSYGDSNDLNLKFFVTMTRATQAVHKRAANLFSKGGLTTAQFAVLETLYHKGDLTINEIIKSILSTSGNITVVICNLEKEQLVERYSNPEDKRSCLISITEKGKNKVEEIFPEHLKDLEYSFEDLSVEEKQLLINLFKKIGTK